MIQLMFLSFFVIQLMFLSFVRTTTASCRSITYHAGKTSREPVTGDDIEGSVVYGSRLRSSKVCLAKSRSIPRFVRN
jgi:hypothetical protein